jgi:peptide chain release factor subunit 3
LAKSLGIFKLVIAVNKMDESTVKWSKERYAEIQNNLNPFLLNTGFDPVKDCVWIPLSGLSGDNLVDVVDKKVCNWY